MQKTVVINAVGLTPGLIGEHTPRLREFAASRRIASITPSLPAVTCTVQSTYLTGTPPSEHGIVGNGWYFRDECEIKFWRQSDKLVQRPRIWERAKKIDPSFTCANICWWYAMYSSADYTVTPRPMYPADGRKLPDCWTHPASLRDELQSALGQFPLFHFWGPMTSIRSTQWIADAAIHVDKKHDPTLSLVYLPHLDYGFQRFGPEFVKTTTDVRAVDGVFTELVDPFAPVANDLHQLDVVCGQLIDHFSERGARIIVLSEYGITPVSRPVHLNRALREKGLIAIREELDLELLDPGESAAFAVADHQIAHIYVNDPAKLDEVRKIIEAVPGVAKVYDKQSSSAIGLNHPHSGDLIALAEADSWFTYYYWLDDRRAPDFARTVEIHRKPGYDPAELFLDPELPAVKLQIAWKLLRRKLGMRGLLDVIGLDASIVKGSHGLLPTDPQSGPCLIADKDLVLNQNLSALNVHPLLIRSISNTQ